MHFIKLIISLLCLLSPLTGGLAKPDAPRREGNDMAIVVNFPEKPIRIPEYKSIWHFGAHLLDFDRDNHLMVGHTGVILVKGSSGEVNYFDFGRYDDRDDLMGPRPEFYGVVRSALHVPQLELEIKARFENGWIANLDSILIHLGSKKPLNSYGRMQIAVVYQLDYDQMIEKARSFEQRGYIFYGAPAHLYCTSFVRKVIRAGGSAFGYFNFTGKQTVRYVRKKFRHID